MHTWSPGKALGQALRPRLVLELHDTPFEPEWVWPRTWRFMHAIVLWLAARDEGRPLRAKMVATNIYSGLPAR